MLLSASGLAGLDRGGQPAVGDLDLEAGTRWCIGDRTDHSGPWAMA